MDELLEEHSGGTPSLLGQPPPLVERDEGPGDPGVRPPEPRHLRLELADTLALALQQPPEALVRRALGW